MLSSFFLVYLVGFNRSKLLLCTEYGVLTGNLLLLIALEMACTLFRALEVRSGFHYHVDQCSEVWIWGHTLGKAKFDELGDDLTKLIMDQRDYGQITALLITLAVN